MSFFYRDGPGCSDFLLALILFVMFALIIGLIAAYVGGIILIVFLIVGGAIGLIFALISYIRALIEAIKLNRGLMNGGSLKNIVVSWLRLFKDVSIEAFKNCFAVAQSAFIRAGGYKIISFMKWMWLAAALMVLVFGTIMILGIIFLQLLIIAQIFAFIATLILIALAVFLIAGIIYALIKSSITLISSYNVNNPFKTLDFSRGFVFSNVTNFIKNYYSNIFSAIGMLWGENISLIGTNFSQAGMYRYFNPIKYFYLTSPAGIMLVTLLFIAIPFILLSIAFIPLVLAELVWFALAKIFSL